MWSKTISSVGRLISLFSPIIKSEVGIYRSWDLVALLCRLCSLKVFLQRISQRCALRTFLMDLSNISNLAVGFLGVEHTKSYVQEAAKFFIFNVANLSNLICACNLGAIMCLLDNPFFWNCRVGEDLEEAWQTYWSGPSQAIHQTSAFTAILLHWTSLAACSRVRKTFVNFPSSAYWGEHWCRTSRRSRWLSKWTTRAVIFDR